MKCPQISTILRVGFFSASFLFLVCTSWATEPERQDVYIEQSSDLTEVPIEALLDIEVSSAAKYKQSFLESPHAITVVTQEDLKQSGALNLPQALKFLTGVQVIESGSNLPDVIIRGAPRGFNNLILVLLDGVPVHEYTTPGVLWSMLPITLDSIDRVEIIRGPSSTLYGANALTGTINIISKKIGDKGTFSGMASGGNFDTTHESAMWSGKVTDWFRMRVIGQFDHDRGYGANNGRDQFDGQTLGTGRGDFSFDIGDNTKLNLYLMGKSGDHQWLHPFGQLPFNERYLIDGFHLLHHISDKQTLELQSTYQQLSIDGTFLGSGIVFDFSKHQFNGDFQYTHKTSDRNTFVAGSNYRYESLNFKLVTQGAEGHTLFSIFVNNDFKILDNLIFTAGGRYEFDTFTNHQLTGRANLTYLPWENQAFRISFARAVKTPVIVEDHIQLLNAPAPGFPPGTALDLLGNPNLSPESILATEVGYVGNFLDKKVKVDIQFYWNNIRDTINLGFVSFDPVAVPPKVTLQYANFDTTNVYGLESDLGYQIFDWWRSSVNYTYTKQTGFDFGRSPTHRVNIKNRFSLKHGVSANILFGWISNYDFVPVNQSVATPVDDYFRLDARIAKKLINDQLEIAVVGENLIDAPHTEANSPAGFTARIDRKVFGTISFKY